MPVQEAAAQDALGGAVLGGATGAIIGGAVGGGRGAAVGAIIGGTSGAIIAAPSTDLCESDRGVSQAGAEEQTRSYRIQISERRDRDLAPGLGALRPPWIFRVLRLRPCAREW